VGGGQSRFEQGNYAFAQFLVCKAAQNSRQPRGEEIGRLTLLKNIRNFVCAAAVMLAVWLGLTFMSDVPPHRYPTLGKGSVTTAAFSTPAPHLAVTVGAGKDAPVSR
jgi:hypothetical protein